MTRASSSASSGGRRLRQTSSPVWARSAAFIAGIGREAVEELARRGQRRLRAVGVLAGREAVVDLAGLARRDVDRGRDAAVAAPAQGVEQELLGPGEHRQLGEVRADALDPRRVARGVLRPGDRARVGVQQPPDQLGREAEHRLRGMW